MPTASFAIAFNDLIEVEAKSYGEAVYFSF